MTPWTPWFFAWQAWHLVTSTFTLRGRRGTWWHRPSLCVAGVAVMALGWLWWRDWFPDYASHTQLAHTQLAPTQLVHTQLVHTQLVLTQLVLTCNMLTDNLLTHNWSTHNLSTHTAYSHTTCSHTVPCCTHQSFTISFLFPGFPMPSLPVYCCLLEEVDMWGYPVL